MVSRLPDVDDCHRVILDGNGLPSWITGCLFMNHVIRNFCVTMRVTKTTSKLRRGRHEVYSQSFNCFSFNAS